MDILLKSHKHYGTLLLALVLAVIVVTLFKGPKPVFQRIVAVLVDINLVVGLATAWFTHRPFSLLHPIFALGAVGLLHASAKSDNGSKVIKCFSIALVLLIAVWAVNAPWGQRYIGQIWMYNFSAQSVPVAPVAQ